MVPPKRPPGGVGEFGGVRGDGGGGFGVKKSNRLAPKDKQNGSTWCLLRHGVALGDFGGIWGVSGWGSGFLAPVLWCEGLPCPKIARFYLLFLQKAGRGGVEGLEGVEGERVPAENGRTIAETTTGSGIWGQNQKKTAKMGQPPSPQTPSVFWSRPPPFYTGFGGVPSCWQGTRRPPRAGDTDPRWGGSGFDPGRFIPWRFGAKKAKEKKEAEG